VTAGGTGTVAADPGYVLDVEGPAAPPRSNGELVFGAPWESRAFGLAMGLADRSVFEWEAFRQALIARIAAFEAAHPDGEGWSYWACWTEALQDVLTAAPGAALTGPEVAGRIGELAARPAGYDHGDEHGHGDGHGHGHGHGHEH
jgi:nitrile hydratase accessory protein